MNKDWFWIVVNIVMNVLVLIGYLIIASRWRADEKAVEDGDSKQALRLIRNLFIFCAICGYGLVIVRFWFPIWRLTVLPLGYLIYITYSYIFVTNGMTAVYEKLKSVDQLERELEDTKKDSKIRRFFMNALSHDMRSPLNAIALNAELAVLSADGDDKETVVSSLNVIKENSQAAANMLNKLLEYVQASSVDKNNICPCDINNTVFALCKRYASIANSSNISLVSDLCPFQPIISTDCSKLDRILSNLIDNAIKFTKQGQVKVSISVDKENVYIRVIDTGCGISPEHKLFLFDEFFQVENYERNRNKGFGMGLAISRVLSKQLGGNVILEKSDSQGSTFTVSLPR